jgi:hypothetical protein
MSNTLKICYFDKSVEPPVQMREAFEFDNDVYVPLNIRCSELQATYVDYPSDMPSNIIRTMRKNIPANCTLRSVKDLSWAKGSPGGGISDPREKYTAWGFNGDDLETMIAAHEAIGEACDYLTKQFKANYVTKDVVATLYMKNGSKVKEVKELVAEASRAIEPEQPAVEAIKPITWTELPVETEDDDAIIAKMIAEEEANKGN